MERLRKSFRKSKSKTKKKVIEEEVEEGSDALEMHDVINEDSITTTTENKPPTRMSRLRNSMRFTRKKEKEKPPESESGENDVENEEIKVEEDLSRSSKLRATLTRKKKNKEKEDIDKKEKKKEKSVNSKWETDEEKVRSNKCEFKVKYLGSVEVLESRGMEVCEMAIKTMKQRGSKTKTGSTSAILQVSGDGLRVIEKDTKGMLVDQVIEKVSFCAPDRNYHKGFAYISRDGASRRWLCHGFMSKKDSGERLSHAVGVAFAVCLERKQSSSDSRDCEGVTGNYDVTEGTFTRFGSFKQGTLTERLADTQEFKQSVPKPVVSSGETKHSNPMAIARPKAGDVRSSMRGVVPGEIRGVSPFKRGVDSYSSLRVNELPSNVARREKSRVSLILEETFENEETKNEINSILLQMSEQARLNITAPIDFPQSLNEAATTTTTEAATTTVHPQAAKTQYTAFLSPALDPLTDGVPVLSPTPEPLTIRRPFLSPTPDPLSNGISLPNTPDQTIFNSAIIIQPTNNNMNMSTTSSSSETINPWDLVPDQPKMKLQHSNNINGGGQDIVNNNSNNVGDEWLASLTDKISSLKAESNYDNNNGIEDQLETEWAALANRNNIKESTNSNNSNPFRAYI